MTSTVVGQGAQAVFGDLRVGVMRIGSRDGRVLAQLAIRGDQLQELVVVDVGQTLELSGIGKLRIDSIDHLAETVSGSVGLTFEPLTEAAP